MAGPGVGALEDDGELLADFRLTDELIEECGRRPAVAGLLVDTANGVTRSSSTSAATG